MTQVPAPSPAIDAAYRLFCNTTLVRTRAAGLSHRELKGRVRRTFRRLCRSVEPTLSVEVGAHEAEFSRRIKQDMPSLRAVAFEANPYVHEKYRDELTTRDVEYVYSAVSQTTGSVTLTIPLTVADQERSLDGHSASLNSRLEVSRSEQVEVPSTPLDAYLPVGEGDRVVAWIDVEGANGPVLESGRALLSRAQLVYIEVESDAVWEGQWIDTDVARFFAELGMVPLFRDIQRDFQHNVVYAAPELASTRPMARTINNLFSPSEED